MATSKLTVTNMFEDGTTIKYSAYPYATDATAITGAKANIMDFNANHADAMTDCIVAPTGSNFRRISAAEVETTEQTLVYAKSEAFAQAALNKIYGEDNGND